MTLIADLARLTAAIVTFDEARLRELAGVLAADAESVDLHEAVLQSHLFCGFPRTLASLDVLRDAGLTLGAPLDDTDPEPRARGAELFDRIYGGGSDAVRTHLEGLSPTFASWIADHAYGRTLSRAGLDAAARELLAVAALTATGHDRQLASHARGAVRCGASAADVDAVLDAIADRLPEGRLGRAREIVERFARTG